MSKLDEALGLFPSVIRCGEQWSPTCQAVLEAAKEELKELRASKWECMGRKQALPEPADCNWPDCGCDPHATKVIEALVEQGWWCPPST